MEGKDRSGRIGDLNHARLFIGVPVEGDVVEEMLKWRDCQDLDSRIRWVSPSSLHVTLIPPWVGDVLLFSEMFRNISRIEQDRFVVELTRVSLGPHSFRPRLAWVTGRLSEKGKMLSKMVVQLVRERFELMNCKGVFPYGFDSHKKEVSLHVTLGRLRSGRYSYEQMFPPQQVHWVLPVTSVALYKSVLKPSGAEYTMLERLSLN